MERRDLSAVLAGDDRLAARLEGLARDAPMVFVAGLPGSGKSLLIRELAHLAASAGRAIHLLQWDVARPCFEASPAGRRYPLADGVTHVVIRKAVGLWARRAVVRWARPGTVRERVLIGETPLIGGRLIELARPSEDSAEPLLASPSARFLVPVPSRAVREVLEAERARRAERPLHAREREDAPPAVLRALWQELLGAARGLGVAGAPADAATPYDPELYARVYRAVLRHRHAEVASMEVVLPTADVSVYDVAVPRRELTPDPLEIEDLIAEVEARHPDVQTLEREAQRWYVV
jgi:hypothetical protein